MKSNAAIQLAKSLYIHGLDFPVIAEAVGTNERTVRRWRDDVRGTAEDWKQARAAQRSDDPAVVILLLKKRLLHLASDATLGSPGVADSLYKVQATIRSII